MVEPCEASKNCNVDQRSFKAYLARWMAATAVVAPFTYSTIKPMLLSTASAAAAQCIGGTNGRMCGGRWTEGAVWDGQSGIGEQMAALSVIQGCLIDYVKAPVTNSTGGTSQGDAGAGSGAPAAAVVLDVITKGDQIGAGALTAFIVVGVIGGCGFVMM